MDFLNNNLCRCETPISLGDFQKAQKKYCSNSNLKTKIDNTKDTYNPKYTAKKNNKKGVNPIIAGALVIGSVFALFKGKGKIKDVYNALKNSKFSNLIVKTGSNLKKNAGKVFGAIKKTNHK